jgi:hypothetical protein
VLLLALIASAQAQASTVEQQIAGLPTVQPFNGETTSTSMFNANWSAFGWASEKGQDTTTGWRVSPAYPTEAAGFYRTEYTAASGSVAAAVTMAVNPGTLNTGRFFSLWIDTRSEAPGARSGYELRFTVAGGTADTYDVTLSSWQAGTRTLLASQSGVKFVNGNSLALADQGGTVSAWTNRGAGFAQLLTASDSTFNQGRVGVGGAGNITRLTSYKAGQLNQTKNLLESLPSVDPFTKVENPLSGEGGWTKVNWASHPGQVAGSGQTGGWGPYNAFPAIHGAFWNRERFTDGDAGAAVGATLSASPSASERYFGLWLDMPNPGSTRTGYEVRFTQTATANTYSVTLSKWQAGSRTVLATQAAYSFAPQSSFALADEGGRVSVWTDTGSGYEQLLSATDSTFTEGYTGIEGAGNITRIRELRAGDSTVGYPGVKVIGEAEAQYDEQTGTLSYSQEASAGPMSAHFDPAAAGPGQPLPDAEDRVTCATTGHRIKVVYSSTAYPASPSAEVVQMLRSIVRRMNSKIVRESFRSSGNTRALSMRVDCDASGAITIHSLSVGPDDPESIQAAAARSLGSPIGAGSVKYLIFRATPSYGTAYGFGYGWFNDAWKTASDSNGNLNRILTSSAVIYSGAWQVHTTIHELTHAMGAILTPPEGLPPFGSSRNHCTDGLDIMCYRDGSPQSYTETRCPPSTYENPISVPMDCGNDTYFNALLTAGGWLGEHWNVGGPENPFLVERPVGVPLDEGRTQASINVDLTLYGQPGYASLSGGASHNGASASGTVIVVFEHLESGLWVQRHTAQQTLSNGTFDINHWTLGPGQWQVHVEYPEQDGYAPGRSDYKEFRIKSGYRLKNRHSDKCLSVSGNYRVNNQPIIQWDCSANPITWDGQVFTLVPMEAGDQYFELMVNQYNEGGARCVDVYGANPADGGQLVLYDCIGAWNQQWDIVPISGQYPYEALIARHSNKCMDVANASTANGAQILQWSCHWGGNQQWLWQAIE